MAILSILHIRREPCFSASEDVNRQYIGDRLKVAQDSFTYLLRKNASYGTKYKPCIKGNWRRKQFAIGILKHILCRRQLIKREFTKCAGACILQFYCVSSAAFQA